MISNVTPYSGWVALILMVLSGQVGAAVEVPSGRYLVDPSHAYITFNYSHLGFSTPHVGFNRFVATRIDMDGAMRATITGDLTIRAVTKPVTMEARIDRAAVHPLAKKPVLGVSATAKLNRSDWALSKYVPAVGDAVSLYITAELVLQDTGE